MLDYCTLFSGSSGNSAYIASEHTKLLIDAGHSVATMLPALHRLGIDPASLSGILVTHEHGDHIKGAGAFSRRFDLPVYANEATWQAMSKHMGEVAPKNIRVFKTDSDLLIGDMNVLPFSISHDTAEPVAFMFQNKNAKVTHMTDLGHITKRIIDIASQSDLVLIESNHDIKMLKSGRYPAYLKQRILGKSGHLSNVAAGEAISMLFEKRCRRFILGHLSEDNNNENIAFSTVVDTLQKCGIPESEYEVYIAGRFGPAAMFRID